MKIYVPLLMLLSSMFCHIVSPGQQSPAIVRNAHKPDSLAIWVKYKGSGSGVNKSDSGYIWLVFSGIPLPSIDMNMVYNSSKSEVKCKIGDSALVKIPYSGKRIFSHISCKNVSPLMGYNTFYGIDNIYFIDPEDSLTIDFYDELACFSGKGSEKMNLESLVYRARFNPGERYFQLLNERNFLQAYSFLEEGRDSCLLKQLRIVEQYKSKLTSRDFDIFKLNCYALRYYIFFREARLAISGNFSDAKEMRSYFSSVYPVGFFPQIPMFSKSVIEQSPIYASMLFEKIRMDILSQKILSASNNPMKPSFKYYFDYIQNDFSGILRDKLFAISYLQSVSSSSSAIALVDSCLLIVKQHQYYDLISRRKREQSGTIIHSALFYQTDGTKVDLSQIRNKLLIVDFWFTGCENCIGLNKVMQPVYEKYKNDSCILFISVSIDKDRQRWLQSIRTGLYTSPNEVNISTGEDGINHKFLTTFNIKSFPKQIFILNSQIVEFNPSIPTRYSNGQMSRSTIAFMETIERFKDCR